jgi:hypothetical protein
MRLKISPTNPLAGPHGGSYYRRPFRNLELPLKIKTTANKSHSMLKCALQQ